MPEDFGPTGIDPEWYDHGPGSEEWKHKRMLERVKWDNEAYERRMRDGRIVKAAEALERFASQKNTDPRKAEDVALDWMKEMARLLSELYKAVREEKAETIPRSDFHPRTHRIKLGLSDEDHEPHGEEAEE